jgi:hypothetical protein
MRDSLSAALVKNSVESCFASDSYFVAERLSSWELQGFVANATMPSVNTALLYQIPVHGRFRFSGSELVSI